MTHYIKIGDEIRIFNDDLIDVSNELKNGFYSIKYDEKKGVWLSHDTTPSIPTLYGKSASRHMERVLTTYRSRVGKSTGVLLVGKKGTGKSLLMNLISVKSGLPVISVTESIPLDIVISVMTMITSPHVMIIDEFEKKYGSGKVVYDEYGDVVKKEENTMSPLLSFLDGSGSSTQRLVILTANEEHKIDKFIMGRPGRIFYRFKYAGLSSEEVGEICDSLLKCQHRRTEFMEFVGYLGTVSYDVVLASIEELNRYPDIKMEELFNTLNIDVDRNDIYSSVINVTSNTSSTITDFSPKKMAVDPIGFMFSEQSMNLRISVKNENGSTKEKHVTVSPRELVTSDSESCEYVVDDFTIRMTAERNSHADRFYKSV